MYAAIDALMDKLDRQIIKHKEKAFDHAPRRPRLTARLHADAIVTRRADCRRGVLPPRSDMNLISKLLPAAKRAARSRRRAARSACSSRPD